MDTQRDLEALLKWESRIRFFTNDLRPAVGVAWVLFRPLSDAADALVRLSAEHGQVTRHVSDALEHADKLLDRYKDGEPLELALCESVEMLGRGLRVAIDAIATAETEPAKPSRPGVTWQQAAERMEAERKQGKPWPGCREMSELIGCSTSTIDKAFKKRPALREWETRSGEPHAVGLTDMHLDNLAGYPSDEDNIDILPDERVEQVMAQLFDDAKDDAVRTWLATLTPDERRQLARETIDRPLGSKSYKVKRRL